MIDWRDELTAVFGFDRPPTALFYECDVGLRFELGSSCDMDSPIRRFLQAHQRAAAISNLLFDQSTDIYVLTVSWGEKTGPYTGLEALQRVLPGLDRELPAFTVRREYDEPDEETYEYWYVNKLISRGAIEELLWLNIAAEMDIEPRGNGHANWIVDFERAVILRAYDDRGLDVAALDKEILRPLFCEFDDWLLPYDRPQMDSQFKTL